LFEATKTSGLYRYLGCFASAGFEYGRGPDRVGADRKTIVFHLVPITKVENRDPNEESEEISTGKTLSELRDAAYAAEIKGPQTPSDSRHNFYRRSREVKNYVLARANGICEACGQKAPFERNDGTPYLEPHHTKRVSDDGPDDPRFVGAVCPTCHRKIHHGKNGDELNDALQKYIDDQERGPPGYLI
jgi:5-methylcytosine-specific restriction protein A